MKLGDLFIKLGLKKDGFDKGIDGAKQKTNAFGSAMKKVGGMVAGVFAVGAVVNFGKELLNIAKQAEGVRAAFFRISDEAQLESLRQSVKGTVSDLELMKRAVMASNFGIPVKNLGSLFEFASKRAQDTGQSIDYLVDSIVTGIGRKSPLILDNLGISMVELNKEMNGLAIGAASVGDVAEAVGRIAQKSLMETGGIADTTGVKIDRLSTKWANLKEQASSLFSESESLKGDLDDWSTIIEIWQSDQISGWDKFWSSVSQARMESAREQLKAAKEQIKWENYLAETQKGASGGPLEKVNKANEKQIVTIASLKKEMEGLRAELELTDIANEKQVQSILREIDATEKLIEKVSELREERQKTPLSLTASIDPSTVQVDFSPEKEFKNIGEQQFEAGGISFTPELGDMTSFLDTLQTNLIDPVDEKMQMLNDTINQGLQNALGSLVAGLGELAVGAVTGKEFGNQVLQVVGSFMQQMGMAFITFSSLFIAFQEAIASMNPFLALGIGVALVGAGAAISGLAKKGITGASASGGSGAASGYTNFNASSGAQAISDNVVFELEGNKLIGVMRNSERRSTNMR